MRAGAIRENLGDTRKWLGRAPFSFHGLTTAVIAILLLYVSYTAILRLRSMKYLVALIFVGAMLSVFLAIPRKHHFLVYFLGFGMPYYVEIVLMERDTVLSITGTFLTALTLLIMAIFTGLITKENFRAELPITIPFVIWILTGFLSMLNTTDRTSSLIAIGAEAEILLIFVVLVNILRSEEDLPNFLRGYFAGFALQCVIYVIQNLLGFSFDVVGNMRYTGATDVEAGHIGSQRGTFGCAPATAALYFSVSTLMLIGVYLSRKKIKIGLIPILGMALGGGCLILAAKRAPLGGFVMGVLTMLFLVSRRSLWAVPKFLRVLAMLAIPLMALLPVLLLRAEANHESDYEERMNLNRPVWNMFHAHPAVGVGVGTYEGVKRDYLPEDYQGWVFKVHNRYLMLLAETGAIGLAAFIFLYLMVLRSIYRGMDRIDPAYLPFQAALFAGLLAVVWEMQWDMFDARPQGYITWFLVALAVVLPKALPAATPAGKA